jgi:hypothetical protein
MILLRRALPIALTALTLTAPQLAAQTGDAGLDPRAINGLRFRNSDWRAAAEA